MANFELCNLTKKYGKITALNNINLDIHDNEFLVLFGPAGAGKTTTLNVIAGFVEPNEGYVKMNGQIINAIEPSKRNISMVFENYALYPHMTVYDNMAHPLRSKLYGKSEDVINKSILRITKLMKIDHLLERLPHQLSNGQRQRVALGRCLVREPNIFLMDEPLAHLDAKLKNSMRSELKSMQANFNTTTIYVTHNYLEALSLADRIIILNKGKIEQIGTSDEIYYTPKNEFVAKLVGEPEINFIEGTLKNENGRLKIRLLNQNKLFELPKDVQKTLLETNLKVVHFGIRAYDIEYSFKSNEDYISGTVFSLEPIGNKTILIIKIDDKLIRVIAPNDIQAELDQDIYIKFDIENALFFDADTEEYIIRHNQDELIGGGANG